MYTALGQNQWALDAATAFDRNSDTFPRGNTHWFRDWWSPLRTETGGSAQVMVRYFELLAEHIPRGANTHYLRDLTWGEYVHFTSGAAGGDVSDLARRAFGRPRWWTRELARAQAEFPAITH